MAEIKNVMNKDTTKDLDEFDGRIVITFLPTNDDNIENKDNTDVVISFELYIRAMMYLLLGKKPYFMVDGVKTEAVLIDNDMFLKINSSKNPSKDCIEDSTKDAITSIMRRVNFYEEPVPLPDQNVIINMPHYRTIREYYGTDPMSVAGCHIFVSDEKKEFSVYHTRWDAQLTFMGIYNLKTSYIAQNHYLPPTIRDKVISCLEQNYLNKRLIWKAFDFLGSTATERHDK